MLRFKVGDKVLYKDKSYYDGYGTIKEADEGNIQSMDTVHCGDYWIEWNDGGYGEYNDSEITEILNEQLVESKKLLLKDSNFIDILNRYLNSENMKEVCNFINHMCIHTYDKNNWCIKCDTRKLRKVK